MRLFQMHRGQTMTLDKIPDLMPMELYAPPM
jgi:hypothetical protein